MDPRPQLFRQELRRRPSPGELVPVIVTLIGAAGLLAGIVWILVSLNSVQ